MSMQPLYSPILPLLLKKLAGQQGQRPRIPPDSLAALDQVPKFNTGEDAGIVRDIPATDLPAPPGAPDPVAEAMARRPGPLVLPKRSYPTLNAPTMPTLSRNLPGEARGN